MIVKALLERIDTLIEALGSPPSDAHDWGWVLLTRLAEASEQEARDLPALADATALCVRLSTMASSGELPLDSHTREAVQNLCTILTRLREDIDSNGEVTLSVKADLARIELYLKDYHPTSRTTEEDHEEEDHAQSGIDIDKELQNRVQNMETALLDLEPDIPNLDAMKTLFREFHTLKGEAGLLALGELQTFCHRVEGVLDRVRERPVPLTALQIEGILKCVDTCRILVEANEEAIRDVALEPVLDHLTALFDSIQSGDSASLAKPADAGNEIEEEGESVERETSLRPGIQTVDVAKLDSIMAVTGEINRLYHSLLQSMRKLPQDSALVLSELGRNCRLLGQDVATLRMVSVRILFARIKRVIRNLESKTHKRVKIVLEGLGTQVDRRLVEELTAPLVHLVRNAIDHGIEPPQERRENGKPGVALITLKASRVSSSMVSVEISDDGRGINEEQVLNHAVEVGLVGAEDRLTRDQIHRLIFHEGFSTAERVADVSGRGVGMNVVERAVEDLHGEVRIHSARGQGTCIEMLLPLSLAALEVLVVKVGGETYLVPLQNVVQIVQFKKEDVTEVQTHCELIRFGDALLPLIRLRSFFEVETDEGDSPGGMILMVQERNKWGALLADQVVSIQQVVVRSQERIFSKVPGLCGTAGLGQGQLGLMMDVGEVLENAGIVQTHAPARALSGAGDRVEAMEIGINRVAMIFFTLKGTPSTEGSAEPRFAINAFKVREFVVNTTLTQFPGGGEGYTGTHVLRGQAIPVFNLARLLNMEEEDPTAPEDRAIIMICEFSGRTIGFLVAGVARISNLSWKDIQPPTAAPVTRSPGGVLCGIHSVGTIVDEKGMVLVLDFEKILQEVMPLTEGMQDSLTNVQIRKEKNVVLLVEDSLAIRSRMAEALRGAGIEVIEAGNGKEALETVHALHEEARVAGKNLFDYLDLILTDIEMPRMDGYTLAREIKSHPELRVMPVILHSSLTNPTIESRATEVGCDGLVSKCDPASLVEQLRRFL